MDYLRAFLVPFHFTTAVMVAVFSLLLAFFMHFGGLYGLFASVIIQIWILKYCYVLIERLADGAPEPPVMDQDMLSPFESRPWMQVALIVAGVMLCRYVGGNAGIALGVLLLTLLPASAALLGMGDNVFQAANPLALFRVIRGLGPLYLLLLGAMAAIIGVDFLLDRLPLWLVIDLAILMFCEVGFFGLIGVSIWLRRRQLGFEPRRSPERTAAREESERLKLRARMLDEVFQSARIGRYVDATQPLANWLRDVDPELAVRDSLHVAEQAVKWKIDPALNPIGSTLIRHLLRFGRPDAALSVFELFRQQHPRFTMDSAPDLRVLAEYAESVGKDDLAQTMRLETPIHHPG